MLPFPICFPLDHDCLCLHICLGLGPPVLSQWSIGGQPGWWFVPSRYTGILVYCCWIAYHRQKPTAIRSTIASKGPFDGPFSKPGVSPCCFERSIMFPRIQFTYSRCIRLFLGGFPKSSTDGTHPDRILYISLCCLEGKSHPSHLTTSPFFPPKNSQNILELTDSKKVAVT